MSDIRARLAGGETLFGTFLGLGSLLATEACAVAGFDWLLAHLEHGGGDERAPLHQPGAPRGPRPAPLPPGAPPCRCSPGSSPPSGSAPAGCWTPASAA